MEMNITARPCYNSRNNGLEKNIQVLEWPRISPDLNIIKKLWRWLQRIIYDCQNIETLLKAIRKGINVPQSILNYLYHSLSICMHEVINKNGFHNLY